MEQGSGVYFVIGFGMDAWRYSGVTHRDDRTHEWPSADGSANIFHSRKDKRLPWREGV